MWSALKPWARFFNTITSYDKKLTEKEIQKLDTAMEKCKQLLPVKKSGYSFQHGSNFFFEVQ